MKFRNQFLKYKVHSIGEDDAGGGGGAGGDGNASAEPGAENNTETDLLDHSTMWDNDPANTEQSTAQTVQQSAAQPVSAAETFNNHVAGIDFGSDPSAMMEAMREGNVESFQEQLKNMQVWVL